jgi:protein gp37
MTNLNSKIEWCDATWNVVTGCTKVSPGCDHCYAEKITERFHGRGSFAEIKLHEDRLDAPLRWRKPRRVFVNSMSDLFHQDVPDGFIAAVWFVMGQCAGCIPEQYRGHQFQILTKRHARMRAWLRKWADVGDPEIPPMDKAALRCGRAELIDQAEEFIGPLMYDWMDGPRYWPDALPGVWLGVSVEDQKRADLRIPALLDTPAAVRFVSCEPLLGSVDLQHALNADPHSWRHVSALDWIIVGGESGPGARPMELDWARSLVEQCQRADVPVFVKQDSGPKPGMQGRLPDALWIKEFPDAS